MREAIRTVILALLFIAVLLTYKTVDADDMVDCNYMPNIERFAICSTYNTWGYGQYNALDYIINAESGWRVNKEHYPESKLSTATGFFGFLNSTWETVDCKRTYDEREQIRCGIKYVELRYQNANNAKEFHIINNWY